MDLLLILFPYFQFQNFANHIRAQRRNIKITNIDNDTLLVALQSVYESVNRYEQLLKSETLEDPENITELLISYDEALGVFKSTYQERVDKGANLPPINMIVG